MEQLVNDKNKCIDTLFKFQLDTVVYTQFLLRGMTII